MTCLREDAVQRAFIVMWNKLYTNQGSILEPLLKDLTELLADIPDTEEMEQLENEIQNLIRVISADRIEIQFQSGIVMEQEIVNE